MPGSVAEAWSAVVASAGENRHVLAALVQCLRDSESNARAGNRTASAPLIGSVGDGSSAIADLQLLCKLILTLIRELDDENVYDSVTPIVRCLAVVTSGAIAAIGSSSGVFSELAAALPEFPIRLQCEVFRAFEQLQTQWGGHVCAFQAELEIWADAASPGNCQGSLGFVILLSRFVERLAMTSLSGSDADHLWARLAAALLGCVHTYSRYYIWGGRLRPWINTLCYSAQ